LEIQEASKIDLTGINQHGFKKGKSTTTLSKELQSLIARALDEDQIGLVASLDLSSAFDVVNVNLLLKRLKIMGLPSDVIKLISVWLRDRSFYVSVDGSNSITYDSLLGTVQGSILGPVLYAIYVSPLSDIEFLLTFADDNYIPRFDSSIMKLKTEMQVSLLRITKWLRDSGLSVNKNKTELCLFSRQQMIPVGIILEDAMIMSKSEMNVLGIQFDSGLKWSSQVANAIQKSQKALNPIKIIRKHFNTSELLKIVTSNYYSILYYNSEVWMLNNLKQNLQKDLMTAASNAIKVCLHYPNRMISYENLQKMTNRATPCMYMKYKLSLLLYKTYNMQSPLSEWIELNLNQFFTSRQTNFMSNTNNRHVIGSNALCNRFKLLNDKINLNHFNLNFNSYKIVCKKLFLTN
jgi:hypothetical protein